jgi:16S rRNA (cytosine1402-N4)-methyltransferase
MEKDSPKKYHIPVLTEQVLAFLNPQPGKVYVDATFGGGGHTRAILEKEPQCTVIAMDWDLSALEQNGEPMREEFPDRLILLWGNFAQIDRKLKKVGFEKVDGILADFGTSFYQLTERPGFSFAKDTPLDMRMSPVHQKVTAEIVVNKATEGELRSIFREYGQEERSLAIARLIVQERKKKPIRTTRQLATLVERIYGGKRGHLHPATKVFQALRIFVNKELDNIKAFLPATLKILNSGGRLVCISFHSLEDRLVKQFFKQHCIASGPAELLTPKVVVPSPAEVARNPASRSAKLRAITIKK